MNVWHIVFVAAGRQSFYREIADLLAGLDSIVRCTSDRLILFCIVDDHIHTVIETDRPGAQESAIHRSIAATTHVPMEPAHRTPVESRNHLQRLVDYLLAQPAKHGLPTPAALWPGSCFLDLIGARRLPGLRLRLCKHLPRFRLRKAFAAVGLRPRPLAAPTPNDLRSLGAVRIVAAAAAAAGVSQPLGRDQTATSARRAAAAVAGAAGIPTSELAFALDINDRSARRLMQVPADVRLCRAVRIRLALEERVASERPGPAW